MNKQELIEKINNLQYSLSWNIPRINKETVLDLIEQLDEPQKVTIPQFVVEYIKYARSHDWDLHDAINFAEDDEDENIRQWMYSDNNIETFARAWLNGYEKEKRYLVRIIGITNYNSYLNYHKEEDKWTIESRVEIDAIRTEHTRKELEEAGFGEVFNSPLFEVEEVE